MQYLYLHIGIQIVIFQDNDAEENFYELIIFPVFDWDSLSKGEQFYPESINDNYIQLEQGSFIFSDDGQNGQQMGISVYDNFYSESTQKLIIHLSCITKDKFLYSKTLQKDKEIAGSLFFDPIIIHSNINDGEGIFSVETTITDTLLIQ